MRTYIDKPVLCICGFTTFFNWFLAATVRHPGLVRPCADVIPVHVAIHTAALVLEKYHNLL